MNIDEFNKLLGDINMDEDIKALSAKLKDSDPEIVAVLLFQMNTIRKLLSILQIRVDLREYDRAYISGKLSQEEWKQANHKYNPFTELFDIFAQDISGQNKNSKGESNE